MTCEQVWDFLKNEFGSHSNLKLAHMKLCQYILTTNKKKSISFRSGKANPNEINIIRPKERDTKINAMNFEGVKEVFEMYQKSETDEKIIECIRKQLANKMQMSDVKKLAYTHIWTREIDTTHKFSFVNVRISYEKITITLKKPFAQEVIPLVMEYVHRNDGCDFVCNNEKTFCRKLNYEDMAANEFVEILKYSMSQPNETPRVVLRNLQIDIDPWKSGESDDWLAQRFFSKKISNWLSSQAPQRICTRQLSLTINPFVPEEDQPMSLSSMELRFFLRLKIRIWQSNIQEDVVHLPEFLTEWNTLPQWNHIRTLDINDKILKRYTPNISQCKYVFMSEFDESVMNVHAQRFRDVPPVDCCIIHLVIRRVREDGHVQTEPATLTFMDERVIIHLKEILIGGVYFLNSSLFGSPNFIFHFFSLSTQHQPARNQVPTFEQVVLVRRLLQSSFIEDVQRQGDTWGPGINRTVLQSIATISFLFLLAYFRIVHIL